MNWLKRTAIRLVQAGIKTTTSESDARYVRFLNGTLLLFILAQAPILPLLLDLGLKNQLLVNLIALLLCGFGFTLNIRGNHLLAKIIVISVLTANTAYFATIVGSSAPVHLWLLPSAVLGLLAFKPSEWTWAALFVGLTTVTFAIYEFLQPEMQPMLQRLTNPGAELQAAHGSTIGAMILTLIFVGMMHQRFSQSESALSIEKAKSDGLLRAILPEKIAKELLETGATKAIRHEDVSLLFADIVGFTPLAASMPAEDVVTLLAEIFKRFDDLIANCGVEKIKTIGDAYMVAGGVPQGTPDHSEHLAKCAIGMLKVVAEFSTESSHELQLRIGLHRGPVVAGVIGTTKFAYDLWGESVNLASRLESSGEPGRIHVSDAFRTGLKDTMTFETRGEITLKGVGLTRTHWLVMPFDE